MKTVAAIIFLCLLAIKGFPQTFSGKVICKHSQKPIKYVNIGIVGKSIGTVSNHKGDYSLFIDTGFDNDSILFSCIGYYPFGVSVSDFKKFDSHIIELQERVYDLAEVVVRPEIYEKITLGYTPRIIGVQAGFKDNLLGYECGIMMSVKKSAFLKTVNINFSRTSYDTIFYRLNIYKALGDNNFENIVQSPIYIELSKEQLSNTVVVDLEPYNIVVAGDFLVTLEHVKDLGPGYLYFNAGIRGRTYIRKTSQANWETISVGLSITVDAEVEQ